MREFWPQIQTREMFISASDLAQNDCCNTVWRWSKSSGENKAFDRVIFSLQSCIIPSYKYNSNISLLLLFPEYLALTLGTTNIIRYNYIIAQLYSEKHAHAIMKRIKVMQKNGPNG